MDKISHDVNKSISRTTEDLPGDTRSGLGVKKLARNLTKELSNTLSNAVPRPFFDALYHSFSELNSKLASGINDSPEPGLLIDYGDESGQNSPVSALPHSIGHSGACEDLLGDFEPSEGETVGTNGEGCLSSTTDSEEEFGPASVSSDGEPRKDGKYCLCKACDSISNL